MANYSPELKLETIKTLVALHGQRATARMTGINSNTLRSWCARYHWPSPNARKLIRSKTSPVQRPIIPTNAQPIIDQHPSSLVATELERNKSESKLNLSRFLKSATETASKSNEKLSLTRKAKDLSEIHKNIFPPESTSSNILNVGVLVGIVGPRRPAQGEA